MPGAQGTPAGRWSGAEACMRAFDVLLERWSHCGRQTGPRGSRDPRLKSDDVSASVAAHLKACGHRGRLTPAMAAPSCVLDAPTPAFLQAGVPGYMFRCAVRERRDGQLQAFSA